MNCVRTGVQIASQKLQGLQAMSLAEKELQEREGERGRERERERERERDVRGEGFDKDP